jgi:Sulfotransferase family
LTKETRFFDAHFHRGLKWYQAHYSATNLRRPMGEVAPTYFASDPARQRIKEIVPDARIVCSFRNPVERVFSLYRVKRAYGMIPWSFEDALVLDPELTESSRYATYLKAWIETFGKERVLPTIYDDLRDSPQTYVNKVADFIEIPRFILSPADIGSVHSSETMTHPRCYIRTRSATRVADWLKARHFGPVVTAVKKSRVGKLFLGGGPSFATLSRQVSHRVQELFLREVEELEEMLQRDLSSWKPLRGDLSYRELTDLDDQFRATV